MTNVSPKVRTVVAKARGQPTFVNVYLTTGEFIGAEPLNAVQALHKAKQLLSAALLDLRDEQTSGV